MRRPGRSLVAGLVLLAVMATGLIGTTVGLDQLEKFRVPSESAAGLEVLSAHFPAGEAQPILVVANTDETDAVIDAVDGVGTLDEVFERIVVALTARGITPAA